MFRQGKENRKVNNTQQSTAASAYEWVDRAAVVIEPEKSQWILGLRSIPNLNVWKERKKCWNGKSDHRYIQFSNQNFPVHVKQTVVYSMCYASMKHTTRVIVFILMHTIEPINNLLSCEFDYCRDHPQFRFDVKERFNLLRHKNEFRKGRRREYVSLFIEQDENTCMICINLNLETKSVFK